MATLVQFLVAGVNGAENGTATFLLRGTASSAASALYNEFEETSQPGTNVILLDANGSAEVYCTAYVDVTIRTSSGDELRTVTVGNSAPLVEVQSTSFTGTDYDGSPANTVGEPITLKAVLDKWITSAGAPDWQILFNGVATNIQVALAGFAGMFINVKDPQYGAEGDGVTDDTTAILAAIDAAGDAGGGIVFFPPGTYQVTALTPTAADVVLMGCGDEASIIRGTFATSALLSFADNTANSTKRVTGLGFASSVASQAIIEVEQSQSLAIDNCKFDCTNITGAAIRRIDIDGEVDLAIDNCTFINVASASALQNLSDDGESYIAVAGCRFVATASFTGAFIDGPDFVVTKCKFDAELVTSGTYYHIDAESNETTGRYLGRFSSNTFLDGGSSGFAFKMTDLSTGCDFSEGVNTFIGFDDPVDLDDQGHIYDLSVGATNAVDNYVVLGSRKGRTFKLEVDNSADIPSFCMPSVMCETLIIDYTDATSDSILLQPTPNIPNGDSVILVLNNTGGVVSDMTFASSGFSINLTSVANGGKAVGQYRSFVEVAGSEQNMLFSALQSPT